MAAEQSISQLRMARRPVRLIFANCPHLDRSAAGYLLLSQNRVQTVLEFELCDISVYAENNKLTSSWSRVLRWWTESKFNFPWADVAERRYARHMELRAIPALRSMLPLKTAAALVAPFVSAHETWLSSLTPDYGGWTIQPAPTIVITETAIKGGYFGAGDRTFAIVSITDFHKKYTPPSLLEFVLNNVQRNALRLAINPRIGCHYPTRACAWDFDAHQAHAKMSATVGYLCGACESLLSDALPPEQVAEVRHWISNEWIGETDKAGTVAGTLKRVFYYDLMRTRGLSPSFRERLRDSIVSEAIGVLSKGLFWVITLAASFIGAGVALDWILRRILRW